MRPPPSPSLLRPLHLARELTLAHPLADLCRLAGLPAAGVICELVKPNDPNGDMARRDDCFAFAREWGLKMISIEQIEQYRRDKGL